VIDNVASIELGPVVFPIERPFTISVTIANSETRPVLTFPDIPGFTKKGVRTTVTAPGVSGKTGSAQIMTQSYQARTDGRFVLTPFAITVNGEVLQSAGAVLLVRPSAVTPASTSLAAPATTLLNGSAFLLARVSRSVVYRGEGVGLTLSFFVADNYPYVLNFTALDRQLQAIVKKIRPANVWEENRPITELNPMPVVVSGRKFREILLFQSVFYPLSARPLTLPAVTLNLSRPRPMIGPPSTEVETIAFSSKPLTVRVRALPDHPLRGQVAVGSFRLREELERQRVGTGRSVRYGFTIEGAGNVAALSPPPAPDGTGQIDVFPPEERHVVDHSGERVSGRKTFTYFIIPRQGGTIALADYFQWIYFDPQRARYDTLRPRLQLQVGGDNAVAAAATAVPTKTVANFGDTVSASGRSLYAGIDALDSAQQPISIPALVRVMANVLIVLMLLGMIFVFFKK